MAQLINFILFRVDLVILMIAQAVVLLYATEDADINSTVTETATNATTGDCSCSCTIMDMSGKINSPGYPGNYPDGAVCLWSIIAPEDRRIDLRLEAYDIEFRDPCKYDVLQVFEGDISKGIYCGQGSDVILRSATNTLEVVFKSDDTINKTGFSITYTVEERNDVQPFFSIKVRLFGGVSSREGRLEVYHNGTWGTVCDDLFGSVEARVVCGLLGFMTPIVEVYSRFGGGVGMIWMDNVTCSGEEESLDECLFSGWGIHDCDHDEDVGMACIGDDHCGLYEDPYLCNDDSKCIKGAWLCDEYQDCYDNSDESNETCLPEEADITRIVTEMAPRATTSISKGDDSNCDFTYRNSFGHFGPPHLAYDPDYYPSNVNCVWTIIAPEGLKVLLKFESMDINCFDASIHVYDGNIHRQSFCGSRTNVILQSASNIMTVQLLSDDLWTDFGFWARYKHDDNCACNCIFRNIPGKFTSLGYALGNYPGNLHCMWTMIAPAGQRVALFFSLIDIRSCYYDVIHMYDGDVKHQSYCGEMKTGIVARSTGNIMKVQFLSYRYQTNLHKGFSASFIFYGDAKRSCTFKYLAQAGPNLPYTGKRTDGETCFSKLCAKNSSCAGATFDGVLCWEHSGILESRLYESPQSTLYVKNCSIPTSRTCIFENKGQNGPNLSHTGTATDKETCFNIICAENPDCAGATYDGFACWEHNGVYELRQFHRYGSALFVKNCSLGHTKGCTVAKKGQAGPNLPYTGTRTDKKTCFSKLCAQNPNCAGATYDGFACWEHSSIYEFRQYTTLLSTLWVKNCSLVHSKDCVIKNDSQSGLYFPYTENLINMETCFNTTCAGIPNCTVATSDGNACLTYNGIEEFRESNSSWLALYVKNCTEAYRISDGCESDLFDCGHGTCIHKDFVCDGYDGPLDCDIGINEEGKETCVECIANPNISIPKYKMCDGIHDCPLGEDESGSICVSDFHCDLDWIGGYAVVLGISSRFNGDSRLCLAWCWKTKFCEFFKSSKSYCILLCTRAYYSTHYRHIQKIDLENEDSVLRMRDFCDLGCVGGDCYHLEDRLKKGECSRGTLVSRMDLDRDIINHLQIPRLLAENAVMIGIQMVQNESNYIHFRSTSKEESQQPEFQIEYGNVRNSAYIRPDVYLCKDQTADIYVPNQRSQLVVKAAFQCGDGDIVNAYARCDGKFDCLNHQDEISCHRIDSGHDKQNFQCKNGDFVRYSMLCDFILDCKDGSDENCVFLECKANEVRCDNGQCVSYTAVCNGHQECFDGSDERQHICALVPTWWQSESRRSTSGSFRCNNTTNATCDFGNCRCGQLKCPRSHCIDSTKLCDGELDCPYGEDERSCKLIDTSRDTSNFRCQNNLETLCLSNIHVCDGIVDCTLADDERLCVVDTCPAPCTCNIYEVRCNNLDENNTTSEFTRTLPLNTRFLDISGSSAAGRILLDLLNLHLAYLFHLNISNCNIKTITNASFAKMPNLQELDLSKNNLTEFKSVLGLSKVKKLDVSQNVIKSIYLDNFDGYLELKHLNLSHNSVRYTHRTMDVDFEMLHILDISYNALSTLNELKNFPFHKMMNLRILLLHNNRINDTGGHVFDGMRNMSLIDLSQNEILYIEADTFVGIETLYVLDLSFNKITRIQKETFRGIKAINDINLNQNEIVKVDSTAFVDVNFKGELVLSNNLMQELLEDTFGVINNLTHLSLANNKIAKMEDGALLRLYNLKTLDIRGNSILKFSKSIFRGPVNLVYLKTDNYKFCCLKPMTVSFDNCTPKADEFSSCENLMRNVVASHTMCVVAVAAVVGNLGTVLYRTVYERQKKKTSFELFVINLAISDFLMGAYLVIIITVDLYYQGSYIWNAHIWRKSALCHFAGVISTLSSEASVFFICLITLDRVFVIKWPLGKIRLTKRSALLLSGMSWLLASCIAVLPIIYKEYFGNEFYSVNGVCIALPLTQARPKGWEYSLAVFVFFNFLTFLLIALGQVMIFVEVKFQTKIDARDSSRRNRDLTVARNLLLVVLTDFMCWAPVGVMGIMAFAGHAISGDVYVWASVFILPVNAGLNPFLYTLTTIIKKEKFVPHQDEQTRLVSVTMNEKKWKAFCQRSSLFHVSSTQQTLTAMFKKRCLKPFEALQIHMELAHQLGQIHKAGLHHGYINVDMIKLFMQNDKIVNVAVEILPKSVKNEGDIEGDIYQLGKIGQALINRAEASAAGPSNTTADVIACGSAN